MDLGVCEACWQGTSTEVLSVHPTSLGRVVYARCACGVVRMCLVPYAADRRTVIGSARPAGTAP
jgi:hypothetical protein